MPNEVETSEELSLDAAPASPGDYDVIRDGNVYKLAGYFVKAWKSRFFRLKGRHLLYYKSDIDTEAPRQKLNLRGGRAIPAAEAKTAPRTPWVVEVQVVEPTPKSVFFCTETEEDMNEWAAAINGASGYVISEVDRIQGHEAEITCHAFATDGKRMMTADAAGIVKVWDMKSRKLIGTLEAHRKAVTAMGFCQNNTRIFTASKDCTLKLWDANTLNIIHTKSGIAEGISACVRVPGARQVVTGNEIGEVQMWNSTNLHSEGLLRGHKQHPITHLLITEDGDKMLSVSEDGGVICWNLHSRVAESMIQASNPPIIPALAADGKSFALAKMNGIVVYSWGEKVEVKSKLAQHSDTVTACTFADSLQIVSASRDRSVMVWENSAMGEQLFERGDQEDAVEHLAVSPSGELVLSVCGHTATVWKLSTMEVVGTLDHSSLVKGAAFIPDFSGIVALLENGEVVLWAL